MKLMPAKCPNCGASLKLNSEENKSHCEFCDTDILVDDAIQRYKLEINANVEITNIPKLNNYIKLAMMHYNDDEYEEAYYHFSKALELDPDNFTLILRRGLCKSMTTNYASFDIKSAVNAYTNSIKILEKNDGDQETMDVVITETKRVIDSLCLFAENHYIKNSLFLSDVNKNVTYLLECLDAYRLLIDRSEPDSQLRDSIIVNSLNLVSFILSMNTCCNSNGLKVNYNLNPNVRNKLYSIRDELNKLKSKEQLKIDEEKRQEKIKKDEKVFLIIISVVLFLSFIGYSRVNAFFSLFMLAGAIVFLPVYKSSKNKSKAPTGIIASRAILGTLSLLILLISFGVFMATYHYPYVGTYKGDSNIIVELEDYKMNVHIGDEVYYYDVNNNYYSSDNYYSLSTSGNELRAIYDKETEELCLVVVAKESKIPTTTVDKEKQKIVKNNKCAYLLKKDNQ